MGSNDWASQFIAPSLHQTHNLMGALSGLRDQTIHLLAGLAYPSDAEE
jgi:hypothetical protein